MCQNSLTTAISIEPALVILIVKTLDLGSKLQDIQRQIYSKTQFFFLFSVVYLFSFYLHLRRFFCPLFFTSCHENSSIRPRFVLPYRFLLPRTDSVQLYTDILISSFPTKSCVSSLFFCERAYHYHKKASYLVSRGEDQTLLFELTQKVLSLLSTVRGSLS